MKKKFVAFICLLLGILVLVILLLLGIGAEKERTLAAEVEATTAAHCPDAQVTVECDIPPAIGFSYPNTVIKLHISSADILPEDADALIAGLKAGTLREYQRPENWNELTAQQRMDARYGGLEFTLHMDFDGDGAAELLLFVPYVPHPYAVRVENAEAVPAAWQEYVNTLQHV